MTADNVRVVQITADELRAMSDDQLRWFCAQNGIAVKPSWSRSKVYQALLRSSLSAVDY
jgi:hypothetical protein